MRVGIPENIPNEFLIEWAIGHFLKNFSSLETAMTFWITIAIDPLHPVYGHVAVRDTNFMHKVRLVDFLLKKNMSYGADWRSHRKSLVKINDLRNRLAHGAIEFCKGPDDCLDYIELTVPSADGLYFDKRIQFSFHDVNNICIGIYMLTSIFMNHAESHERRINSKRRSPAEEKAQED